MTRDDLRSIGFNKFTDSWGHWRGFRKLTATKYTVATLLYDDVLKLEVVDSKIKGVNRCIVFKDVVHTMEKLIEITNKFKLMKKIYIKGQSVTLDDVNNSIISEKYTKMGEKIMVCHLTLKDGWEVAGTAGVVNPELFSDEIGRKVSREKALDKVWMHLGSLLQNQMAG